MIPIDLTIRNTEQRKTFYYWTFIPHNICYKNQKATVVVLKHGVSNPIGSYEVEETYEEIEILANKMYEEIFLKNECFSDAMDQLKPNISF